MKNLRLHPFIAVLTVAALLLAGAGYLLTRPKLFIHHEHHPALAGMPKTTLSKNRQPADPINMAMVGQRSDVVHALLAAGWVPADPITWKSSLEIAASSILGFSYPRAPVSNLYLWNRCQDLAFEQPLPGGARRRHHVRLWRTPLKGGGPPVWIGSATFDTRVGLVRHSLKPTHRIAPDVDDEREKLADDLVRAGRVGQIYKVSGVGQTFSGQTANGDWYYTDGEMTVCILEKAGTQRAAPPTVLASPVHVRYKDRAWNLVRPALHILERIFRPNPAEAAANR
jgi:hypothetical protein